MQNYLEKYYWEVYKEPARMDNHNQYGEPFQFNRADYDKYDESIWKSYERCEDYIKKLTDKQKQEIKNYYENIEQQRIRGITTSTERLEVC